MPEFRRKQRKITAEQYDGDNPQHLVVKREGSIYLDGAFGSMEEMYAGAWVVTDEWGIVSLYSKNAFEDSFAPPDFKAKVHIEVGDMVEILKLETDLLAGEIWIAASIGNSMVTLRKVDETKTINMTVFKPFERAIKSIKPTE